MFESMTEYNNAALKGYIACKEPGQRPDRDRPPGPYKVYYQTYPINLERPGTGQRTMTETCRICRDPLTITIRSISEVAASRLRRRIAAGVLLLTGVLVLTLVLPSTSGQAHDFLTSAVVFAGIGALVFMVTSSFGEFYLALSLKYKGTREHKLYETIGDKLVGRGLPHF
jgi:hypothetical protein